MKIKSTLRGMLPALGALIYLASQGASALAQCAMCKASVQAGASSSANPQMVAQTLNLAVLVLLVPPVLIFSGLFIVLMRYRRGVTETSVKGYGRAAGALD